MVNCARVMHHVPGRIRMKMPHAKGNEHLLAKIKEFLSPLPGVKDVEVNPITGSVIVYYNAALYDNFQQALDKYSERAKLFSLPESAGVKGKTTTKEIIAKTEAEAEFLSE